MTGREPRACRRRRTLGGASLSILNNCWGDDRLRCIFRSLRKSVKSAQGQRCKEELTQAEPLAGAAGVSCRKSRHHGSPMITSFIRYRDGTSVSFRRRFQCVGKVMFSSWLAPGCADVLMASRRLTHGRERAVDGRLGVNASGVEQRHRAVFWLHQQHDLGTAQDDGFGASFDQTCDYRAVGIAR
jgi:hypothetical protein